MMRSRRHFPHWAIAAAALLSFLHPVNAEDYPARPVTLIVPFAAGSSPDAVARVLSPRLSELLGQPIVIENVGGGGGMIGAARVAKAPPDGYHILLGGAGPNAVSQVMFKNPLFDAKNDFASVALLAESPLILIARKDFPAVTLQEFLVYVRKTEGRVQYGYAGAINDLTCAMVTAALGIGVTRVPYRGGGQGMQDLIAGRIDYSCPLAAVAVSQIRAGQVKAIAILTKHRSPILPELATAHEQGLVDFDSSSWFALFLPQGAPSAVVQRLHQAAIAAMDSADLQERLKRIGAFAVAPERRSPEYLQAFVESEISKWAGSVKAIGSSSN